PPAGRPATRAQVPAGPAGRVDCRAAPGGRPRQADDDLPDDREWAVGWGVWAGAGDRGCAGAAFGLLLRPLGPAWAPPPAACGLAGRAGFSAAAAKTPFSTLVIVCEITGDLGLLAPALGVCVGCFVLSGRASLFESQPASRADSPVHHPTGAPATVAERQ